ncbi:DUF397 domain-containing protein [Streptomyces scabiei]|uniref:DUF397 domain-containing protein n=1 Tax=Streptomyces scabiei TaxID=1930 RepID=UPI0038F6D4F1
MQCGRARRERRHRQAHDLSTTLRRWCSAKGPDPDAGRRSSWSDGDECVQVADGFPGLVPVRDSRNPAGGVLVFGAAAWSSFVAASGSRTFTAK